MVISLQMDDFVNCIIKLTRMIDWNKIVSFLTLLLLEQAWVLKMVSATIPFQRNIEKWCVFQSAISLHGWHCPHWSQRCWGWVWRQEIQASTGALDPAQWPGIHSHENQSQDSCQKSFLSGWRRTLRCWTGLHVCYLMQKVNYNKVLKHA